MDYKQKYEQAIFRMNKWVEGSEITDPKEVAEFVFSELKESGESEDERIRKALIQYIKYNVSVISGWRKEELIAWLEKQKDHEDELERAYKCADEVQYRKGYEAAKREFEKQGEQIDIVNKEYWRGYREGKQEILDKYSELEKQGEQKVTKFITKGYITPNPEFFQWIYNRLVYQHHENPNMDYMLSLKERIKDMQEIVNVKTCDVCVKQNPAWSEEDEEIAKGLNNCIDELEEKHGWCFAYVDGKDIRLSKIRNWLKSLKERYTQKPSKK